VVHFDLPTTLSDIVTKNKDQLKISQVWPGDLQHLTSEGLTGLPKGTIREAHIIALTFSPDCSQALHILGQHEELNVTYITSKIVAVSNDASVAQTQSGSLYRIRGYVEEDISSLWIAQLCAFLHIWGLGKRFGLPHFYF
jgi:hypothetical protein